MSWSQFISLSFAVQSDTEGRRKIIGQQVEAVLLCTGKGKGGRSDLSLRTSGDVSPALPEGQYL